MSLTRRDALAAAALSAAASLDPGRAAAQARRVLIVASQTDIPNFDPHAVLDDGASMLTRNVYDALVRADGAPPRIVPQLAASWTISPDGTEYVFKLDPEARFHDGTKVTTDAVRYSFGRLLTIGKGAAWMIAGILRPEDVMAPDPETVRIKLAKPFGPLLQVLPWVWIVNPAPVEANKGSDNGQTYLRTNTAGSGAFRVRRAEPGNLYEFERVPDGWRKGGGNLTGGIWKIIRETASQRLAVARGEIHFAMNVSGDDIGSLKDRPGVAIVNDRGYRTFTIKMNTRKGPLADVNLRRAIACAVDYDAMLNVVQFGKLMAGPLIEGMIEGGATAPRMDLDAAKAHLARSAQGAGGLKLAITYISGNEQQRQLSLILLNGLRTLGIDLDIRPLVWPDMVALARSPETFPDFFPVYQTVYYNDPDSILFQGYHSSLNGAFNNPVYANPAIDDLIVRARVEADPAKRSSLYGELQRALVDDAPCLFGVEENRKYARRADVKDYVYSPLKLNTVDLFPISL